MAIHVSETNPAPGRSPRTQKSSEDDAAVASEKHDEAPILGGRRDAFAKRRGVGCDLGFVPRTIGRANEVSIRRRNDITEIGSA
jgi:hypothetical protein